MTDSLKKQDVELDDNEGIEEAHDPKNAPADSAKVVDKATQAGKGQAPARKGDKRSSEGMPSTKAGMLNAIYSSLMGQSKADIATAYKNMFGESVVESEPLDVETELQGLVDGEATLSEEFKAKTAVLFEAAVTAKVSEIEESLAAQYKSDLAEEIESITESMITKIDGYLNRVVEKWMEENTIAIHNSLRTEIAEDFMKGLGKLFKESYVSVPDEKVDLVDDLANQVEELEEKLNNTTKDAIELSEMVEKLTREKIINEAARGLADTQVEKLTSLVEKVEFDDANSFSQKVATIKESFFNEKAPAAINEAETDDEEIVEVSDIMASYLSALRKTNPKE